MHKVLIVALLLMPSAAWAVPPDNIIIVEFDDLGRHHLGTYRGAAGSTGTGIDVFTISGFSAPVTPNIDNLADAGVRIDHFIGAPNCTPGKNMLRGGLYSRRKRNLHGFVSSAADPPTTTVEVDPIWPTIFREAKKLGRETYFAGKWHQSRSWELRFDGQTHIAASGVDVANVILPHNPTNDQPGFTLPADFGDISLCGSHASGRWVSSDLAGNYSMPAKYTSDAVFEDAQDYYENDASPLKFMWIHPPAPHQPNDFGQNGVVCGTPGNPNTFARDDCPPGDTCTERYDVHTKAVEFIDDLIGQIQGWAGYTTANTMIIVIADNGGAGIGQSDECGGSFGSKGSPFPCGTRLPAIFNGGEIISGGAASTREMPGLHHQVDLFSTIIGLMGGTTFPDHDGLPLHNCLRGLEGQTPVNCASHDVVVWEKWSPLGGAATGTLQRPPLYGDGVASWDNYEIAGMTMSCGGDLMYVHRDADESVDPDTFCESFYQASAADLYQDSDNPARATTSCVTFDGKLEAGDFTSPSITADEQCALDIVQRAMDGTQDRNGGKVYGY